MFLYYGYLGSGKTYTMGSGSSVNVVEEEHGIIPRVIHYMFQQGMDAMEKDERYRVEYQLRFMEIYGEEIRDLLEPLGNLSGHSKVSIRESENGGISIVGASEVVVENAEACMRLLEKGTLCRTTASTQMNSHSSRSHAVLTLSLDQNVPNGDEMETRSSYFHFVDLAGSERQKRTLAKGKRLKEGIEINKGLLSLGNVISALGDEKKRGKVHIPYRDSKLTRMLQDSLGGNSRTLMIACVSPADYNFEETLNALKYANRARNIQNKAVVNRDPGSAVVAQLRHEISVLKLQLGGKEAIPTSMGSSIDYQTRCEESDAEVLRLTNHVKKLKMSIDTYHEAAINANVERDFLQLKLEEAGIETTDGTENRGLLEENVRKIKQLEEELLATKQELEALRIRKMSNTSISETELIALAQQEISNETEELHKMDADEDSDGEDEAAEAEMQRIFQQRQQQLGTSVIDLSTNINLKEQLIENLQKSKKNYERMKEYYEGKMHELTDEVRQAQKDRETLLHEIQTSESQNDQVCAKRKELAKKLKEKDEQLHDLKKKEREMQKFMQLKNKADQQVRQLYSDISNMKKQKADLVRKMRTEKKNFTTEAADRQRELMAVKRASQKDKRNLEREGAQKALQNRVMKKKLEDVTAANRRLRQNQVSRNLSQDEKRKKQWLSSQIKKLAKREEHSESLELELKKREAIVSKMEKLHGLRNELQGKPTASIRDVLISPLKGPSTTKSTHRPLGKEEEQTLFELEERIESCQAQLEYKDDKISKIVNDVSDEPAEELSLEDTSLPEARTMLKVLFEMAVSRKKEDHQARSALRETQANEKELSNQVASLESHLNQVQLKYDEDLTVLQKEHEQKLAFYMDYYRSNTPAEEATPVRRKASSFGNAEELELLCTPEKSTNKSDNLVTPSANLSVAFSIAKEQHEVLKKQIKLLEYKNNRLHEELDAARQNPRKELKADHQAAKSSGGPSIDIVPNVQVGLNFSSTDERPASEETSIFQRLANPTNFTGIHKNRSSTSKPERKPRDEKLRNRRYALSHCIF